MDPGRRSSGEAGYLSREAGDRRRSSCGQTERVWELVGRCRSSRQGLALCRSGCYSAAALSLTAQPGAWGGPQACGPRA